MKIMSVKDLENIRQEHSKRLYWPDAVKVNIGMASCGIAAGAQASYEMAKEVFPAGTGVQICQTGCIGFCEEEPLVEILGYGKPRVMYKHITEKKIADAIKGYMEGDFNKKWILGQMQDPRNVLEDDIDNALAGMAPVDGIPYLEDIPFYRKQVKIALRNCGYIDPDSIEEYIARKGYLAFLQALQRNGSRPTSSPSLKNPDCADAAAAVSQPESSGPPAPNKKGGATSSAMRMKATRAHTWIAASWRVIPTACWKVC